MRAKTQSPRLSVSIPSPVYDRMLEHAEANGISVATLVVQALIEKYGIKISPAESRRTHEAAEKENERLVAIANTPFPASLTEHERITKANEIIDACRALGIDKPPRWNARDMDYYQTLVRGGS